jgi:preprotein translocase subunit SecA
LLRLFGGQKIQNFIQTQISDDSPLESKLITRSLNSAQQRVEERAYQQRKSLFDYDEVLNRQREIIYSQRTVVLNKQSLRTTIIGSGEQMITEILLQMKTENFSSDEILSVCETFFGKSFVINSENPLIFQQYLFNEFWLLYQAKRNELAIYGDGICDALERTICLINIDKVWREQLQEMPLLREAVGWRGYGQQNPLYEYKKDALNFFSQRIETITQLLIYDLFRSSVL